MRASTRTRVVAAAGLTALTAITVACGGRAAQESGQVAAPPATQDADILVVGLDVGPHRPNTGNADTVALVHVPRSGDTAAVVSLPRDTWVTAAAGLGPMKLSMVYRVALDRARHDAPGADPVQLAQRAEQTLVATVQQLTGVTVNHYAQVDLTGFGPLTDAVGGVEVCLRHATQDRYAQADFHAGRQVVDGAGALAFVRQRHGLPDGDLDRVRRQQAFLAGLADKLHSSGALADPARRVALVTAVRTHVVLDQNWDLAAFAQQVVGLSRSGVRTATIPWHGMVDSPTAGQSLRVDPAEVRAFVHRFDAPAGSGTGTGSGDTGAGTGGSAGPSCVD